MEVEKNEIRLCWGCLVLFRGASKWHFFILLCKNDPLYIFSKSNQEERVEALTLIVLTNFDIYTYMYRVSQKKLPFWNFSIGNPYHNFGPLWTTLDRFGSFEQLWTTLDHLDHFGPLWTIWTTLDHLDHFWMSSYRQLNTAIIFIYSVWAKKLL